MQGVIPVASPNASGRVLAKKASDATATGSGQRGNALRGGIAAKPSPKGAPAADTAEAAKKAGNKRRGRASGTTTSQDKGKFNPRKKSGKSGGGIEATGTHGSYSTQYDANSPGGVANAPGKLPRMISENHVPAHTFATSTIPRAGGRRQPGASAYSTADDDKTQDFGKPPKAAAEPQGHAAKHGMMNPATESDSSDADDVRGRAAKKVVKSGSAAVLSSPEQLSQGMGFQAAAAQAGKSSGMGAKAGAAMVAAASQKASKGARAKNPNLAKVARPGTHKTKGGTFK
jgi:hypothetical protein